MFVKRDRIKVLSCALQDRRPAKSHERIPPNRCRPEVDVEWGGARGDHSHAFAIKRYSLSDGM
jgi:hypothetical protein